MKLEEILNEENFVFSLIEYLESKYKVEHISDTSFRISNSEKIVEFNMVTLIKNFSKNGFGAIENILQQLN